MYQRNIQKTAAFQKGIDTGGHPTDDQILPIQLDSLLMQSIGQRLHGVIGCTDLLAEKFLAPCPEILLKIQWIEGDSCLLYTSRADGAHGIKHNFAALRYVLKYYTQKTGVRQEENADLSKLSDFENSSRSFFSPHRAPFPGILTENKYSNGKKCSMIGAEEARQLQGNRERGNSYA